MTTVSVTDLTNAKTDVDHIAAIATSTALTATDRLGTTKKTLQGAINSISAITDRGAWVTATAYSVKDVVLDTGVYYICITAHTSGGTFAGDAAKWRVYQGDLGAYHSVDVVNDIRGNDFSNRKLIRIATERGNPTYYLDTSDTVSADDDFLVIVDAGGNRWKLVHYGVIDIRWAGAVDGQISTAAIQKVFDASATKEVLIEDGTYLAKELTVTSNSIRKISGNGKLKLENGANTYLLNFDGANECEVSIEFDGNKANQSGGTQANRSSYILVNIVDASTVGVTFKNAIFRNAYYGAALNNSGIRTSVITSYFYDCGNVGDSGSCDAIFNGPTAQGTTIAYSHFVNCTDYGLALDTSSVVAFGNHITNCFAGIGSLVRGTLSNHKIFGNTISECVRPIDYFISATSLANEEFDNISIYKNTISSTTCVSAAISFSDNHASLPLGNNIFIEENTIYTPNANGQAAIFLRSNSGAESDNVKVNYNTIIGDATTQSARNAIDVSHVTRYEQVGNTLKGVDLGVRLVNVTGQCRHNTFDVLRDAYTSIQSCDIDLEEAFEGVPRRGAFMFDATTVRFTGSLRNMVDGFFIYDNAGAYPACSLYLEKLDLYGTITNHIYVDGSLNHNVVFGSYPTQNTSFVSNVVQASWNINNAPTAGTWDVGARSHQLVPVVGQPKEWVCTVAGTPGTWVSTGNL